MGQVAEKMKVEPEVKKKNQVEKLDIENTIVEQQNIIHEINCRINKD